MMKTARSSNKVSSRFTMQSLFWLTDDYSKLSGISVSESSSTGQVIYIPSHSLTYSVVTNSNSASVLSASSQMFALIGMLKFQPLMNIAN